jgi:hypothetical protein
MSLSAKRNASSIVGLCKSQKIAGLRNETASAVEIRGPLRSTCGLYLEGESNVAVERSRFWYRID